MSWSLVVHCAAKAFHLKYEEVLLDANIRKWDVQVLSVSLGGRAVVVACHDSTHQHCTGQ